MFGQDGELPCFFGGQLDAACQGAAEAAYNQRREQDAYGKPSSRVAHDFNIPLVAIGGNLDRWRFRGTGATATSFATLGTYDRSKSRRSSEPMPGGGVVPVPPSRVRVNPDAPNVVAHELPTEDGTSLLVADAGAEMPAEILHRRMEPRFSSERSWIESGQHPSTVYGFVRKLQGHLPL